MFRKNLISVWIGILVLSGMFLMGQETWPPTTTTPPAPVPKTGQFYGYGLGDDGALQKGVAWPSPRFTDNANGTVTDNLTGLIWTKAADCDPDADWSAALGYCNALAAGTCGLSDGSVAGDWRLPNVREIQSLVDYGQGCALPLPTGHPFTGVPYASYYWSSTTAACNGEASYALYFYDGTLDSTFDKSFSARVWCVRGGQ
jgi:Protein of unknown function (DUF1566)